MTNKVYKSAMGKPVDLGALLLQNENVRAVGNMGVNARGDKLDSNNKIIDKKNQQVRKQYAKQTNVGRSPTYTSTVQAKQAMARANEPVEEPDTFDDLPEDNDVVVDKHTEVVDRDPEMRGGLAAAIAKARAVKQEPEKTLRQRARESRVKKI